VLPELNHPENTELMKKIFTLLLSACMLSLPIQAQQVEKVLVKSINPESAKTVQLDLDVPYIVQTWKSNVIRVQLQVGLENSSENILKSLISAGRYNVKATIENEVILLSLPQLAKQVRVGGQELIEQVSLTIFLPDNLILEDAQDDADAVGMNF
jgi:hypothetical protein